MSTLIETELSGSIAMLELEIATARDGDWNDVLDVCESLLRLIERLDQRLNACE